MLPGQQVVEEILDAQGAGCPPEYFNIKVEEGHEYATQHPGLRDLPFLRTRYDMSTGFSPNNPRQQVGEMRSGKEASVRIRKVKRCE